MDKIETTRRSFLAAIGVAGAAAAVPVQAATPRTWADAAGFHGAALRAAYLAELERFAETLRPQFESGGLRAHNEKLDDLRKPGAEGWDRGAYFNDSPHWEIERLVGAHFGLCVKEKHLPDGMATYEGDEGMARLLILVSPHAATTGDGWVHECYQAVDAVTWDVIAHARARGWYVPAEHECEDPLVSLARDPTLSC